VNGIRSNESGAGEPVVVALTLSQSCAFDDPSTVTRVRFFAAVAWP